VILKCGQKALDLAVHVYVATEAFPRSEQFGLTSQLRRAATSIVSNIAEGKAVGGLNFPKHLTIAHGSEAELQTQIVLAQRLSLLDEATANELLKRASEIGRMLVGLRRSLPRN
jgi:four helix bundle protein